MVIGTGIDIIEIERIDQTIKKWGDQFLNKIFTRQEISYCNDKAFNAQHYAVRFAGKEAFYKAASEHYSIQSSWKAIEIANLENGKPIIILSDELKEQFKDIKIHLSLSHSANHAIAMVILEKKRFF
jgi:holo-[acyl-carrier protein] synthase